ncbi:hypothetical protein UFOVP53_12 [uncultured Caudovirales phage]|uniref:HNHc domain containing protein n=1 Tax=uncultured Caudovirales phage TaxID=2100421 RepID=A0A6J5KTH6_9CAUD|nr:hypothetical protein UFOVP53_12 [uncultured Caudovirales phage]
MKTCSKCKENKQLNEFNKDCGTKDGLKCSCRVCCKIEGKRVYSDNLEKYRLRSCTKYKTNPNYNKNWKKANPDKVKKSYRIYSDNNPGKIRAKKSKRRAIKLNALPNNLSQVDIDKMKDIYVLAKELEKQDNIKRYVHHIVPLQEFNNLGIFGLHVPWNLEILTKEEHLKRHEELKENYKIVISLVISL